jgi:hypothetical protein
MRKTYKLHSQLDIKVGRLYCPPVYNTKSINTSMWWAEKRCPLLGLNLDFMSGKIDAFA